MALYANVWCIVRDFVLGLAGRFMARSLPTIYQ